MKRPNDNTWAGVYDDLARLGYGEALIVRAIAVCWLIPHVKPAPAYEQRLDGIYRAAEAAIDPETCEFRYPRLVFPGWRPE